MTDLERMTHVATWALDFIRRTGGYMSPEDMVSLRTARSLLSEAQAMCTCNVVASTPERGQAVDDGGKGDSL